MAHVGNARRSLVVGMGALAGLTGIEHGLGAVLQGHRPTGGVVFPSWPGSAFFAILNGEPAMSLVQNYLLTGILAIVASLALWRSRSRSPTAGTRDWRSSACRS
ncbi:MAG: hypothetical protein IBX62_09130 [Coriobacteriia bacterium]|nr:hypothetical protein [Coriobacteriia bacterium]